MYERPKSDSCIACASRYRALTWSGASAPLNTGASGGNGVLVARNWSIAHAETPDGSRRSESSVITLRVGPDGAAVGTAGAGAGAAAETTVDHASRTRATIAGREVARVPRTSER